MNKAIARQKKTAPTKNPSSSTSKSNKSKLTTKRKIATKKRKVCTTSKRSAASISVPIDQPFPTTLDETSTTPLSTTPLSTKPRLSILPNGIKIMTQDSTSPMVYVNARVNVGAMHEDPEQLESGNTYMLARAMNEFASHVVAHLPNGTEIKALPTRECLDLHASAVGHIDHALKPVVSLLTTSLWTDPDIIPELTNYYAEHGLKAHSISPGDRFEDEIHSTVFKGYPLSNPTFIQPATLLHMSSLTLQNWQKRFFTANRITIGAVGVDHEYFVSQCQALLGEMPSSDEVNPGDNNNFDNLSISHNNIAIPTADGEPGNGPVDPEATQNVALSWHGPDVNSPFLVPMTILSTVIGSARAFSSGGPGKGMYARATTHLLGRRPWVEEVASFFYPYTGTSAFGLMGVVKGPDTNRFINEMMDELTNLADSISEVEVERAKNQLKRQLFAHHESASVRAIELARHASLYGKWKADEYIEEIDKTTTAQVKQSAKLLFDADSVLITTLGNPRNVEPKWHTIQGKNGVLSQSELDKFLDFSHDVETQAQQGPIEKVKSLWNMFRDRKNEQK